MFQRQSFINGNDIKLYINLVYSALALGISVAASSLWHVINISLWKWDSSEVSWHIWQQNTQDFSRMQAWRLLSQSPQVFIWILQHLNIIENPAQTSHCSLPLGCLNSYIIDMKTQQPPCNFPADSCFHYSSAYVSVSEYQTGTAFVHHHTWPEDN